MKGKQTVKTSQRKKAKFLSVFPVPFIIAFVIDLVYGIFYYGSFNAINFYDTASYFAAAENIVSGKADLLRTPLYPLFLYACRSVSEEHVNRIVVTVQMVVFYLSIFVFFKLLERFTSNKVMLTVGTVFYGCMSSVIVFNTYMLTESLSVSGTVLLCYLIVLFSEKRKPGLLTACAVLALILTMIRPSMIFLYVVVALAMVPLFAGIIRKRTFKWGIVPVITLISCVALLFGYMAKNKKDNNYFGLSYVSEMNRFYDVIQADIWQDNSDRAVVDSLQAKINDNIGVLGAAIQTEEEIRDMEGNPERITEFNKEAISGHKKEYLYFLLKKTLLMGNTKTQYNLTNDTQFYSENANTEFIWPGDFIDFNINFTYLVCLVSFIVILDVLFKRKKLLKGELLITLVILGQLGVNILSGPAEFHRLNVICYPLTLLLAAALVGLASDNLRSGISEKNKYLPENNQ